MENKEELEEVVKKVKRQYYKDYREKNKDRIKEINRRYWINLAKKELEKKKGDK